MNARQLCGLFLIGVVSGSLLAAAGDVLNTPTGGIAPSFRFRPDIPFQSLKEVPTWTEVERMLDNPYALDACPVDGSGAGSLGNAQGFGTVCTAIQRRPAFRPAGCTYDLSTGLTPCNDALMPPMFAHPLDYNPITGEQARVLDPAFPGVADFDGRGPISAGRTRIAAGSAPVIDYNSPLVADANDPGEPPGYSAAAICGTEIPETRIGCVNNFGRLFDPNFIPGTTRPRGAVLRLRKPSVGQNYLVNATTGNPANLLPSIPSDYIRDRRMANVLGKALFWDMQLGSDGVQSCASCHFSAGADTRLRNQLNPNHLGGDTRLELFRNRHPTTDETAADQDVNRDLAASDFPTHRLTNNGIPGEPLLNPGNVIRDTNDVVSSMGVRLRGFDNIPIPGTGSFSAASNGVRSLLPDIGIRITDEIPLYGGRRRVEPRNSPTMINAVLYFDNFWDGRARHDFNGGSVFGASDPQGHVWVDQGGTLVRTRQLIRYSSMASLMLGPALSDFELSFRGRNWPRIGKKLLQGDGSAARPDVVPLAAQLVSTSDSVLGPFSNQGGSQCAALGRPVAAGRPGLCIGYRELVQSAFFPALWQNVAQHLNGIVATCTDAENGVLTPAGCDPFDGFVLDSAAAAAVPTDRSQFTQMEGNFGLFAGLAFQAWTELLISDDTPFDRFLDQNPQAFRGFSQTLPLCSATTPVNRQPCLTQVEGFTRALPPAGTPDRLFGMDLFFGTNLTGRNPNFRSARCGNCHSGGLLSTNGFDLTARLTMADFVPEFTTVGTRTALKRLGKPRMATGFLLEAMVNDNAQGAVQRQLIGPSIPVAANNTSPPAGAAIIDMGMYNIGVRPIDDDALRGGNDAFGWPLSLASLALKNVGGIDYVPGTTLPTFDPEADSSCAPDCTTGGLFPRTKQDQTINPGFTTTPLIPRLPPHLAKWVNPIEPGRSHPEVGEMSVGLNTRTGVAIIDSYLDVLGPFNPSARLNQQLNAADGPLLGTFPGVNRVGRMGDAKVPQLRNVELTGPYFHNGGKLTLRQVVNFYAHGGDFPVTNVAHRDFQIVDLDHDVQSVLTSADRIALTAFLLTLTDERVAREQAPFDRPELFLPIDGRAPDNTGGRSTLLTQSTATSTCGAAICFRRLAAIGAAGNAARLPAFLNVRNVATAGSNNDHFDQ
jgi:cytochrome c peroxidase